MEIFETRVIDVIKRTPGVKSFRFNSKEGVNFKAGQFFFVTIKIEGAERTKHFSFSNSPTEKGYIEFTKRITGSEYSKALDSLKKGDWAKLKMPYGSFLLDEKYEKVVMLTGGIGITPIRSICRFVTDKKLDTDMVLVYGNNKEEDIIFRGDFDEMTSENKNLRVVYTLTSPDADKNKWPGRTGYIDENMIKSEIPDFSDRVFYISGPPGMVDSLKDILKNRLNVKDDKVILENFTGY